MSTQRIPSSPWQALRNFLSSDAWRRSRSWWTGWRWGRRTRCVSLPYPALIRLILCRLSYSVFFAAFDMTRRVGLRVKAFFGGDIQPDWANTSVLEMPSKDKESSTPTFARIAQATTIVTGGVAASLAAEVAGRPFRARQRITQQAAVADLARHPNPIVHAFRTQGFHPSLHPDEPLPSTTSLSRRLSCEMGG